MRSISHPIFILVSNRFSPAPNGSQSRMPRVDPHHTTSPLELNRVHPSFDPRTLIYTPFLRLHSAARLISYCIPVRTLSHLSSLTCSYIVVAAIQHPSPVNYQVNPHPVHSFPSTSPPVRFTHPSLSIRWFLHLFPVLGHFTLYLLDLPLVA